MYIYMDVQAMYTNMTGELARVASSEFLNGGRHSDQESMKVNTQLVLQALYLCLDNNLFYINGKLYKQVEGVGTGVKLAPLMPV